MRSGIYLAMQCLSLWCILVSTVTSNCFLWQQSTNCWTDAVSNESVHKSNQLCQNSTTRSVMKWKLFYETNFESQPARLILVFSNQLMVDLERNVHDPHHWLSLRSAQPLVFGLSVSSQVSLYLVKREIRVFGESPSISFLILGESIKSLLFRNFSIASNSSDSLR